MRYWMILILLGLPAFVTKLGVNANENNKSVMNMPGQGEMVGPHSGMMSHQGTVPPHQGGMLQHQGGMPPHQEDMSPLQGGHSHGQNNMPLSPQGPGASTSQPQESMMQQNPDVMGPPRHMRIPFHPMMAHPNFMHPHFMSPHFRGPMPMPYRFHPQRMGMPGPGGMGMPGQVGMDPNNSGRMPNHQQGCIPPQSDNGMSQQLPQDDTQSQHQGGRPQRSMPQYAPDELSRHPHGGSPPQYPYDMPRHDNMLNSQDDMMSMNQHPPGHNHSQGGMSYHHSSGNMPAYNSQDGIHQSSSHSAQSGMHSQGGTPHHLPGNMTPHSPGPHHLGESTTPSGMPHGMNGSGNCRSHP